MTTQVAPAARSELTPTGTLGVGINHGNFLLVTSYAPGAEPRGPAPDLASELGRRLGGPVEFVAFATAGKLADAVKTGVGDVAFLGAEPQRAICYAFAAISTRAEA
jgi:polar amino acid transport system substrate-binding protein